MRVGKVRTGIALGALGVAGLLLAPSIQAQTSKNERVAPAKRAFVPARGEIGTFTPAAADPKLAAVLARSGLPEGSFRFTPAESRGNGRGVTVAVRASSSRALRSRDVTREVASAAPVGLAPISYNLGASVGWKRLAVSGDVTRVELVDQPGSRERADIGVSYTGKRLSGRVSAAADRPLANTPVLIGDKPSYSIDVGGSYSLTRNLDVTAGVRYRSEEDRLPKFNESRRESQAVYVGTAFRF
ncbi:hypothetical protein P6144_08170 [Sphingomonas sp. HITSZ_GF]|uniref:hypothetical protein n=1 Tax=Sphingomonas sp. HITSZ_GF TaxID=3037247 RepID=UPI00240E7E8C|nr:hypothetical protein [Sphingomonas sp. HITSZ_GF]MDG2533617.1 hypothetical protein [Sphingomonas sp. HITSZ_GF]